MSNNLREFDPLDRQSRWTCAGAAAVATFVIAATMLGLFHDASPSRWLQPTPDLLAQAEACHEMAERAARIQCVQAVVAAYGKRQHDVQRLAQAR